MEPETWKLPGHARGVYFPIKLLGLYAYYAVLLQLGLTTMTFKFISFLVLNPLVKYFFHYQKPSAPRELKRFTFSTVSDSVVAYFYFVYTPAHLTGSYYGLFPLLTVLLLMVIEWIQYFAFDYGTPGSEYKVRMSLNPFDHLLVIVISSGYYIAGLYTDFDAPATLSSFPHWVILLFIQDFTFGFLHYYTHVIPSLWKLHLYHHQYKREELNSFANFYANIFDSFVMNAPFLLVAMLSAFWLRGDSYHFLSDVLVFAALTHHKYSIDHVGVYYFFEFEFLDMIFGKYRVGDYHNVHHKMLNRNLGGLGITPDWVYYDYMPLFGMKPIPAAQRAQ